MGQIIGREAEKQGLSCRHFVNRHVPENVARDLGLERVFNSIAGLDWTDNPAAALTDFLHSVDHIFAGELEQSPDGAFTSFMYTAHPLHLPIIAYLLEKHAGDARDIRACACLFYVDTHFCLGAESEAYRQMLQRVSALIELFDPQGRLRICGDSSRIKNAYAPYFQREIELLPIPLASEADQMPVPHAQENKRITIGYVGDRTVRVGYDLVYHAYKKLKETASFGKIDFKVKHGPRELQVEIHRLFHEESVNITHIDKFLTDEEYQGLLVDCDIILLPYRREQYPCQTSGIFVDALSARAIAIVPENTWMADQLEEYGAGETFLSGDADSLAEAIERAVNQFDKLQERVSRNIEVFREHHSAQNLLARFSELSLEKRAGTASPKKSDITRTTLLQALSLMIEVNETASSLRKLDVLLCDREQEINEKNQEINEKNQEINEKNQEINEKNQEIKQLENRVTKARNDLDEIKASRSWRITAPLRRAKRTTSRE